jgi:hypothetical protein
MTPDGKEKEYFANMNLLSTKDIRDKNIIYSPLSFHMLTTNSELFDSLRHKKLIDLKIPYNDILILKDRMSSGEIQIEFEAGNIFKD